MKWIARVPRIKSGQREKVDSLSVAGLMANHGAKLRFDIHSLVA
jgi:hypothetical protein